MPVIGFCQVAFGMILEFFSYFKSIAYVIDIRKCLNYFEFCALHTKNAATQYIVSPVHSQSTHNLSTECGGKPALKLAPPPIVSIAETETLHELERRNCNESRTL